MDWGEQFLHGTVIPSDFKPAWWCSNPHLQTLIPYLLRQWPRPRYRRERLELPDGDFLDLDWLDRKENNAMDQSIVIILHGLEGSSNSHYVRSLATALSKHSLRIVVMHHRGCSGVPNRKPYSYHSGKTDDIAFVVETLKQRYQPNAMFAIGFSLGGNILLKWLGELEGDQQITAAVAVSVPFDLGLAANKLEQGFSQVYQWRLVNQMRNSVFRKKQLVELKVDLTVLEQARTFREFDDCTTAPLNGFVDSVDYYTQSSCWSYLKLIRTPVLILQARDDPFISPDAIPGKQDISPYVRLELSQQGGHVGFIAEKKISSPLFWLEQRIVDFVNPEISNHTHVCPIKQVYPS